MKSFNTHRSCTNVIFERENIPTFIHNGMMCLWFCLWLRFLLVKNNKIPDINRILRDFLCNWMRVCQQIYSMYDVDEELNLCHVTHHQMRLKRNKMINQSMFTIWTKIFSQFFVFYYCFRKEGIVQKPKMHSHTNISSVRPFDDAKYATYAKYVRCHFRFRKKFIMNRPHPVSRECERSHIHLLACICVTHS